MAINLILTKLDRIYGRIVGNACVKYRKQIFIGVGDIYPDGNLFQIFCQFEQTKIAFKLAILNLILSKLHRIHVRIVGNACVNYQNGLIYPDGQSYIHIYLCTAQLTDFEREMATIQTKQSATESKIMSIYNIQCSILMLLPMIYPIA